MGRVKRQRMRRRAPVCCLDGMCFRDVDVKVSDLALQAIIDGCTPEEKCFFVHLLMERGLVAGGKVQREGGSILGTWGVRPPGGAYPG